VTIRPASQMWLPLKGTIVTSIPKTEHPVESEQLLECVLERGNMLQALKRVEANRGAPGVDGLELSDFRSYLKERWPSIKASLLAGEYVPQPVKRVEIPKASGGMRKLGIPTVLDRLIQQALMQVLQKDWDPGFSEYSYGFRPNRSAHQAVSQAQKYVKSYYTWVVDVDLEKFFDTVNHDKLMGKVRKRVSDRRAVTLIRRYLEAGVLSGGVYSATEVGTPQGGPLSPLLANLLLDEFDHELTSRGLNFVRYADDVNIYVRSRRAGCRVLRSISRFLSTRLKLKVNESKSAVDRPWNRTFLGFSFSRRLNRIISPKSLRNFKETVRSITNRTRGKHIKQIIDELKRYLIGWHGYYGFSEVRYLFRELDSWIKRRLRCYLWKQWGRRGYRELVNRGVSRDLAWNTSKSAHGPWRLSRSPALAFALPARYFVSLGLPRMFTK